MCNSILSVYSKTFITMHVCISPAKHYCMYRENIFTFKRKKKFQTVHKRMNTVHWTVSNWRIIKKTTNLSLVVYLFCVYEFHCKIEILLHWMVKFEWNIIVLGKHRIAGFCQFFSNHAQEISANIRRHNKYWIKI